MFCYTRIEIELARYHIASCCTVSNYQTECCPTAMRGTVGTVFQIAIVLGLMVIGGTNARGMPEANFEVSWEDPCHLDGTCGNCADGLSVVQWRCVEPSVAKERGCFFW